jgi:putative two-component system response regulator
VSDFPPILLVDDDAPLRRAERRILERFGYEVVEAGDVAEARRELAQGRCGLVLCDIDLPGESGLVLVDEVGRTYPDTAIVMVTAVDDAAVAGVALDHGAYGYVIKPFEPNALGITVTNALIRRRLELENRAHRERLEELVAERTAALEATMADLHLARAEVVRRLAVAAEYKDPETATHLERKSRYAEVLACRASGDPGWAELVRLAAPMHDIGKIGIPDEVLLKPGIYDDHDRAVMARHPEIGARILGGSPSALLQLAATVALTHHERWDGSGYPAGLAGEDIPLVGRIVAIADVFDALSSRRRYKAAMGFDEAVRLLLTERGRHFDPDLVDAFVAELDAIRAIHERWSEVDDEAVEAAAAAVGDAPVAGSPALAGAPAPA